MKEKKESTVIFWMINIEWGQIDPTDNRFKYIKITTALQYIYLVTFHDYKTEKQPWAEPYDECLCPAGRLHPPKYLTSTWFSADSPDLAILGQEHHKTWSCTTCQKDTHQQLVSSSVRLSASPARRKWFSSEPDYPCDWWKICHLWICKNLWFADQTYFLNPKYEYR